MLFIVMTEKYSRYVIRLFAIRKTKKNTFLNFIILKLRYDFNENLDLDVRHKCYKMGKFNTERLIS